MCISIIVTVLILMMIITYMYVVLFKIALLMLYIDKVSSKQCIGLRNFMPHLSNYDFTHVNQNLLTSL